MMAKKSIVFVILIAACSVLLVACGGGGEGAGEAVTTIRVWTHQNDAFNEGLETLAESYMAENEGVEITFETFDYDTYIQTLQTSLPAGTEADILQMFGSWVCSYVEGGNLAKVPDSVISLSDAQSMFFAAPLGGYTCDGGLYGLPQEFNIEYGATLVNTAIAEAVGVDVSDGWATWDDLIADAQAMTEVQDGVMLRAGYHFTASDALATSFHSLILQYGGQYLVDGEYRVNTPEGLQALELLMSLVDAGVVDPVLFNDEENWVGDSYFEETSAMGLVGPWVIPEYAGDFPEVAEATIYVPLPSVGDDPLFAAASGWGLSVSANSKVQEAAWEFIRYVALDTDNAVQWNIASGTLPAIQANATGANADQLVAEFPYFEPFLGLLKHGRYEGQFADRDFVWYEVAYPEVLNFLQGNATAEETLETMEHAVND